MQMMGKRGVTWRTPSITADGMKIFAAVIMLVQTVGITIVEKGIIHIDQYTQEGFSKALAEDSQLMVLAGISSVLQIIGGLAVPIFAFLLVEGFLKTSDYKRYILSVVAFAVFSEVPYDLANSLRLADWSSQNALVTMSISLLMLYFIRMFDDKKGFGAVAAQFMIVLSGVLWVTLFRAQYGLCIVLLVAIFYIFRSRGVLKTVLGVIVSALYVTGPISFYLIWCYNEKRRDKFPKYAYYIFYPLHLLILGTIAKYAL